MFFVCLPAHRHPRGDDPGPRPPVRGRMVAAFFDDPDPASGRECPLRRHGALFFLLDGHAAGTELGNRSIQPLPGCGIPGDTGGRPDPAHFADQYVPDGIGSAGRRVALSGSSDPSVFHRPREDEVPGGSPGSDSCMRWPRATGPSAPRPSPAAPISCSSSTRSCGNGCAPVSGWPSQAWPAHRAADDARVPMHVCQICGVPKESNPQMEFRYCPLCKGNSGLLH